MGEREKPGGCALYRFWHTRQVASAFAAIIRRLGGPACARLKSPTWKVHQRDPRGPSGFRHFPGHGPSAADIRAKAYVTLLARYSRYQSETLGTYSTVDLNDVLVEVTSGFNKSNCLVRMQRASRDASERISPRYDSLIENPSLPMSRPAEIKVRSGVVSEFSRCQSRRARIGRPGQANEK